MSVLFVRLGFFLQMTQWHSGRVSVSGAVEIVFCLTCFKICITSSLTCNFPRHMCYMRPHPKNHHMHGLRCTWGPIWTHSYVHTSHSEINVPGDYLHVVLLYDMTRIPVVVFSNTVPFSSVWLGCKPERWQKCSFSGDLKPPTLSGSLQVQAV